MRTRFEEDNDENGKDAQNPRVDQLFFKSRTVIIAGGIDDKLAQKAVTHLLALAELHRLRF